MGRITRRSLFVVLVAAPFGARLLGGRKLKGHERLDSDVPVGTIYAWNGGRTPDGWVPCDGRMLNKAEYSRLFHVIGSNFNDSLLYSRFQVPNLRTAHYIIKA